MAKVLIVDNDKDICDIMYDFLKGTGYKVTISYNGADALEKIRKRRFDLVLLDNRLSDLSGIDILKEAKNIRPQLSAIMISGYGDKEIKKEAKKLGASDFLEKPFNIDRLARLIEKALTKTEPAHA